MKRVTFYLGPASGLATRGLVITRMHRAGDDTPPAAQHNADAGAANDTVAVNLPDNTIWQAVLTDTLSGGGTSEPRIINFSTGSAAFPGPSSQHLSILHIEDLSSSSSSSSSSSVSSSSSSISTSSSSISTSSSSQSESSSSSQSVSTSSSSSSESSSSQSSGSSGL